jgi:hypothetical protein
MATHKNIQSDKESKRIAGNAHQTHKSSTSLAAQIVSPLQNPQSAQLSAYQLMADKYTGGQIRQTGIPSNTVAQLAKLESDKLNVAGEQHDESGPRRDKEQLLANEKTGSNNYWTEGEFTIAADSAVPADPYELRYKHILQFGLSLGIYDSDFKKKESYLERLEYGSLEILTTIKDGLKLFYVDDLVLYGSKMEAMGKYNAYAIGIAEAHKNILQNCNRAEALVNPMIEASTSEGEDLFGTGIPVKQTDTDKLISMVRGSKDLSGVLDEIVLNISYLHTMLQKIDTELNFSTPNFTNERSEAMHKSATARATEKGLWKIGDAHAKDLNKKWFKKYNLLSREDFNEEYKKRFSK